jgi:hypothetical protein
LAKKQAIDSKKSIPEAIPTPKIDDKTLQKQPSTKDEFKSSPDSQKSVEEPVSTPIDDKSLKKQPSINKKSDQKDVKIDDKSKIQEENRLKDGNYFKS